MNKRFIFSIIIAFLFSFSSCTNSPSTNPPSSVQEKPAISKTEAEKRIEQFRNSKKSQNRNESSTKATYIAKGRMMNIPTTDGIDARVYVNAPKGNKGKVLFVFHEKWGLNDYIMQESDRLADNLGNVMIVAFDMYDGKIPNNLNEANQLMQAVKDDRSRTIISSGMGLAGSGARIGTLGWGFGGSWSLKAAATLGSQGVGCVMYYGMPAKNAVDLAPIRAEVLSIFANNDTKITPEIITKFIADCKTSRTWINVKSYDAAPTFANPNSSKYDEIAAKKANAEAIKFLKSKF